MHNECLGEVTEYKLSVLRRLAMTQEKPEGALKGTPPGIGLNEKSERRPTCIFCVLSFGPICNVVQCTVFPEKGALGHFSSFFPRLLGFSFFWWNFKGDIHHKRDSFDLEPSFYGYSSTLQILLSWMLANLTDM